MLQNKRLRVCRESVRSLLQPKHGLTSSPSSLERMVSPMSDVKRSHSRSAIPAKGPTFAEGASRQHRCQRASRRDPPHPAWRRHCLDYPVSPEEPAPAYPVTTMVVGIPTACPNAKRFPVLQEAVEEQAPHLFPEAAGTPGFHLRLPACNIAVEQERQHQRKDGRQVFLAVVVLKAVALVLQGKFRFF